MSTVPTDFVSGHPLSPPRSTDGATPEPHRNSCGVVPPMYSQTSAAGPAALHGNSVADEASYGSSPQSSMDYHNSPFSHTVPLHPAQVIANGAQVETPPPTSDDEFLRGSSEPSPSQWFSPPDRSRARPKPRLRKGPRSPRRAGKQRKLDYPGMPTPLSVLTKHMDVPIKDMEEWVHRPAEERHKLAKQKGKVPRPMNSFMLYRAAYSDRAKAWFAQTNHQIVSKTAGDSWKLESPEIRKKYEYLAKLEKIHHERAHPGYRFTPEKDKKKRDKTPDEDRRGTKYSEAGPSHSSPFSNHTTRSVSSDLGSGWDSRGSTPFGFVDHGLPAATGGYFSSSWHSSNPGRPAPGMMPSPEPSQFMQQTVHPSLMGSHVEDVRFKRVGMQDVQYTTSTSLAGLPGAAHHELLQPQTAPGAGPDGQLDPQLLGFQSDASNGGGNAYNNSHYSMWQDNAANNCYLPVNATLSPTSMTYPTTHAGSASQSTSQSEYQPTYQPGYQSGYQSGLSAAMDGREAWDPNREGSMETGGEFDSWINSHQSGYP